MREAASAEAKTERERRTSRGGGEEKEERRSRQGGGGGNDAESKERRVESPPPWPHQKGDGGPRRCSQLHFGLRCFQLAEAIKALPPSSERKDRKEGRESRGVVFFVPDRKRWKEKKQACSALALGGPSTRRNEEKLSLVKTLRHLFPRLRPRLKSAPGQALDKSHAFPLGGFGTERRGREEIGARKRGFSKRRFLMASSFEEANGQTKERKKKNSCVRASVFFRRPENLALPPSPIPESGWERVEVFQPSGEGKSQKRLPSSGKGGPLALSASPLFFRKGSRRSHSSLFLQNDSPSCTLLPTPWLAQLSLNTQSCDPGIGCELYLLSTSAAASCEPNSRKA